jgi:hypothetical protein
MLTINKTKQHCLDILNDARQSGWRSRSGRPATAPRSTPPRSSWGWSATSSTSRTPARPTSTAWLFAVRGGIGYWRMVTDYANDDSFDQEIFIRRVKDPLTVYLDPDINEFDGSDAKFGFVFTDMPKDEFEAKHPEWKDRPPTPPGRPSRGSRRRPCASPSTSAG